MIETNISEFNDNVKVYYTNQKINLPNEYRKRVENHWESLLSSGKKFFNGDGFSIQKIEINEGCINIFVGLTDYAHFLYTIHKNNYEDNDCRIIHTSVLIQTSDNKFAIGEMNEDTAFPFKLQFIGGGIDKEDIKGEILDLEHNIKKEILEELGIEAGNKDIVKSLKPCYLKSGGKSNFLSAIFKLELLINEDKLKELLNNHNEKLALKMEMQEIRTLIFLNSEKEAIEEFVTNDKREKDENLIATLEAAVGIKPVLGFSIYMNKYEDLKGILEYSTWNIIKKIDKGWSEDDKYYIKNNVGQELLLRVSDISKLQDKKKEYEILCEISKTKINMSMPISFGVSTNNKLVYSLLTWVNGNDAELVIPKLGISEQYELGIKLGKILKCVHTIPAPENQQNWKDRFNNKIDMKIRNYNNCGIEVPHADKIIKYINDNRYLLENRPQTIQHGDFHVGNLIITENKEIGVIDFNRYDFGDPWEEFNRIVFSLNISKPFTVGQINGYFDNKVPDEFFKLMALYIASNALSSVPWAIPFGKKEVEIMLNNIDEMLKYYDYFNGFIPNWYKSELFKEI